MAETQGTIYTHEEALRLHNEAKAKGYGRIVEDYTDTDNFRLLISEATLDTLKAQCTFFLIRRLETCGGFVGRWINPERIDEGTKKVWGAEVLGVIDCGEKAFHSAAHSYPDLDHYNTRIREAESNGLEYICFWHLHPFHYRRLALSHGDVAEIRIGLEEDKKDIQLTALVYADNERFELGAYGVHREKVFRYPVKVTP